MQITFDVSTLTPTEKAHIVQFITDYPEQSEQATGTVQSFTFPSEEDEDEIIPTPDVSFGLALVPLTPPPTTTGVTLDKSGLPWDDRIHSSTKAFVADGTWRKRRGVDDALIAQVEAELKAVMNIPAAVPSDEAPMMPMIAVSTVPAPPPLPAVVPPPPVAAVPPVAPAAPVAPEPNAYLNLIQLVTDVVTKKKLTRAQVDECIVGVDPSLNLQLLSKRPDLIPQIAATIRTLAA